MNIVGIFLNPRVKTGGHRRYLEFFQALADKGHNVTLLLNKELEYNFTNIEKIEFDATKKRLLPYSLSFLSTLKRNKKDIVSDKKNDFVVIHGETHLYAGIFVKRILKTRLLFSLRSNRVVEAQMKRTEPGTTAIDKIKLNFLEFKYRMLEHLVSAKSDLIAFQSTFDRDSFLSRNRKSTKKAIIISGNIGGKWFDPDFKETNSSTTIKEIVFAGTISRRKGINYLVDAVLDLNRDNYPVHLTVLGTGDLQEEVSSKLKRLKAEEFVTLEGRVEKPLTYISKADLVVVPSIFDSFPDVILESMHVGTPVIAAKSGGIPDMIPSKYIFEVASKEAIYNQIKEFIENNDAYMACKKEQKDFKERFFFDWADAHIEIMEKHING